MRAPQRPLPGSGRYGEAMYVPSIACTRRRSRLVRPRMPRNANASTARPTQMISVLTPSDMVVTTNTNEKIPIGRFITRYASDPSSGGLGRVPSRCVVVMSGLLRAVIRPGCRVGRAGTMRCTADFGVGFSLPRRNRDDPLDRARYPVHDIVTTRG